MPRHALERFFERLVVATLPLWAASCGSEGAADTPDQAAVVVADLSATVGPDLADPIYMPPPDTCDITHPPVFKPLPAGFDTDGGVANCVSGAECAASGCPTGYDICCAVVGDGGMALECQYYCAAGRRPAGLVAAARARGCAVGAWLADAAHLEAASVHAFARLADELLAHGAPERLIRRARRARRDELRHARTMARLARAHGVRPRPVEVAPARPRPLAALAEENGVEGCVRETFGALVATFQARAAGDASVRRAMAGIAADETRHAALAWDVDAWLRPRLDGAARARVAARRREAVEKLAAEVDAGAAPALVRGVGLPDLAQARRLFAGARALWNA